MRTSRDTSRITLARRKTLCRNALPAAAAGLAVTVATKGGTAAYAEGAATRGRR